MKKIFWMFMCAMILCVSMIRVSGVMDFAQASTLKIDEGTDLSYPTAQELTLPDVIKSKMLFQHGKPFKVWGADVDGRKVTVTLKKGSQVIDTGSAVAVNNGWEVSLGAVEASYEEYTLVISDGHNVKTLNGILFGELYLSAGQSNMALNVKYCSDAQSLLKTADNPYIRFYISPELGGSADYPFNPAFNVPLSGMWGSGDDSAAIGGASAVTYTFALELFDKLNKDDNRIPVGFLNAAKGSTSIQAWFSRNSAYVDETVLNYLTGKGQLVEESEYNKKGGQNFNQQAAMFNSRIAPLSKMNVKGVLWYQGENNVGNMEAGNFYRLALNNLIKDWSNWINDGEELPLIFAHLAPHNYKYEPTALPYMWEGMSGAWAMNPSKRAQVAIYDVPLDWYNSSFAYRSPIHPIVKTPIGKRMAQSALGLIYGDPIATSPTYNSHVVDGRKLILKFDNVADGLKSRDGRRLDGFTLCGEDMLFYKAEAEIVGTDEVVLTSDYVKKPYAAAYAFTTMPLSANLSASNGFVAAPFRTITDNSQMKFYHPKDWQSFDFMKMFYSKGSGTTEDLAAVTDLYNAVGGSYLSLNQDGMKDSCLQIDYTLYTKGTVGVAPLFPVVEKPDDSTMHNQFATYDNFSIYVKNPDNRNKTFKGVYVELMSGEKGYLKLVGGDGAHSAVIPQSEIFNRFSFDLSTLIMDGEEVNISEYRSLINKLEIHFEDMREGVIYIDNAQMGNIDAYDPVSSEQPVPPDDGNDDDDVGDKEDKGGCAAKASMLLGLFPAAAYVIIKKRR